MEGPKYRLVLVTQKTFVQCWKSSLIPPFAGHVAYSESVRQGQTANSFYGSQKHQSLQLDQSRSLECKPLLSSQDQNNKRIFPRLRRRNAMSRQPAHEKSQCKSATPSRPTAHHSLPAEQALKSIALPANLFPLQVQASDDLEATGTNAHGLTEDDALRDTVDSVALAPGAGLEEVVWRLLERGEL